MAELAILGIASLAGLFLSKDGKAPRDTIVNPVTSGVAPTIQSTVDAATDEWSRSENLGLLREGHNNMVPFFGSSVKQNVDPNATSGILDRLGGSSSNFFHKSTPYHQFEPQRDTSFVYGAPTWHDTSRYNTDALIGKYDHVHSVDQQQIGPGMGVGGDAIEGGFHPRYRPPVWNVNGYRKNTDFQPLVQHGKSVTQERTQDPNMFQYRPETVVNQENRNNLPTKAFVNAPTQYGGIVMNCTDRPHEEYYGHGAAGNMAHLVPDGFGPQGYGLYRTEQHRGVEQPHVTGVGGVGSAQGGYHLGQHVLQRQERETTVEAPITGAGYGTGMMVNPHNAPRVTDREQYSQNDYYGAGGAYGTGMMVNPHNAPRHTDREQYSENNYFGAGAAYNGVGGYDNQTQTSVFTPRTTDREQYSGQIGNLPGAAGGFHQGHYIMPESFQQLARNNLAPNADDFLASDKEQTLEGRQPAVQGTSNMLDANDAVVLTNQRQLPNAVRDGNLDAQSNKNYVWIAEHQENVNRDHLEDRNIDPAQVAALADNPYNRDVNKP